ncbi:V-type ATP synthase subunit C [Aedoeadaptatus ivorii]|uniref:V-type ATP synthase subunit C n=1 Tax=Aedoeadaptatus ivorii TaxID=54006 RepID=A0A448UZK9_9FIRM|nr:V-type ATPase subunit [Peptoniphilus ivorii]MDQ0508517.1 V/A-type H+-transporting ATPase subunit C [Peptoniphilus ivorii]VEJ34328.1 V-type ATP synthase subunit C [Peptoniphilus ivorii]
MNYAAVNTKAVAVYARYLKAEIPLKLLEAGNLKDAVKILEESWGLSLGDSPDLLQINVEMEKKVYEALSNFVYYLQGESRKFYEALLLRYELRDLKRIFRAVYHHENIDMVRNSMLAFDASLLPADEEISGEHLFEILSHTQYGRMLSVYKDVPGDRILFYIEMELDRAYYENLLKEAEKLKGADKKVALALLNRHVDLLNILYIYRGKKTYDILSTEMANFVIRGGNIPRHKLQDWVYADDVAALVEAVGHSSFSFLFKKGREDHMTDIYSSRDLSEVYREHFLHAGQTIAKVLAISVLLEFAVRDVSTVLEGLRLGFGKQVIRNLLTIPVKEGEVWQ